MSIYTQKQRWKVWLFLAAMGIIGVSLWYNIRLVDKIAGDERAKVKLWANAIREKAIFILRTDSIFQTIAVSERKKVELWAEATKELGKENTVNPFVLEVIKNNEEVPVILTDMKGRITSFRNLDAVKAKDSTWLRQQLDTMRSQYAPIVIDIYAGQKDYLFYKDSRVFSSLKNVINSLIKSFINEVAVNSASVPVVYTDSTKQNVIAFGNLDSLKMKNPAFLKQTIAEMSGKSNVIEVDLGNREKNYIFYQDSFLLKQLKFYPFVQFAIIGMFLLIAYSLFSTARKSEQNQVWVGMAKETAHQLGTPLSSLIGWLEYMKLKGTDEEMVREIEQDVKRFEMITERFSKIGSVPKLEKENVMTVLEESVNYIRQRTSAKVNFSINSENGFDVFAPLNIPLFAWVIENLCRNAVDAMSGEGSIRITVSDQSQFVYIDISDTGKGISKSKFKTVFEPGYTTKQRGWGLGLSLTKRIIENYHSGKIFVKESETDKGTTFRIVLNK
jgi:nitrogen-specific signal transduction histidine kinase